MPMVKMIEYADAPPAVRGSAPLVNQAGFYAAFGITPGDKMYLPPELRVSVW